MFQFPHLPPARRRVPGKAWRVAPFGYPGVIASDRPLPRAYRSYSTPFIGSRRQGIHRAPVVACPLRTTPPHIPPPPGRPGQGSPIHSKLVLLVTLCSSLFGCSGAGRPIARPRYITPRPRPLSRAADGPIGGGDGGARTPDLRRAKAALSQSELRPRDAMGGRSWNRTTDLGLIRTAL